MFHERKRRGEFEALGLSDDFTFIMITGDGGMDIGMGPAIGTALRNHKMIIVEYDNEGYMNTGSSTFLFNSIRTYDKYFWCWTIPSR